MSSRATVQSPKAYDLANLQAVTLATRLRDKEVAAADSIAELIGEVLNERSQSEIDGGVTPSKFRYLGGRPVIDTRRYGALLDGSTSDHVALTRAITVASIVGGEVFIAPSADGLAIASAQLPIVLPSNVVIRGVRGKSKIVVTGAGLGNLFVATNASRIGLHDLVIEGNGQGNSIGQGAALSYQQSDTATVAGGDVHISGCTFSNFRSYYWLWFRNISTAHEMSRIWVTDNTFLSQDGNCIGPTSTGPSSWFIAFQGQANGTVGKIRHAYVDQNVADCQYIKGFGVAWESTVNIHFTRNTVLSPGRNGGQSDESVTYGFLVYDNSPADGGPGGAPPDLIYIEENTILAPRDAGLYCASPGRVFVRRNYIAGQTSTATTSLPKGAIAISGAALAVVEDNTLDSNFWNITVYGAATAAEGYIRRNRISNVTASGAGIYVATSFTGTAARYEVTDNTVLCPNASARAFYCALTSTQGIGALVVKRNTFDSAYACLTIASTSGVALIGFADISDNHCIGRAATSGGLIMSSLSDANQRISVCRNKFTGTWGTVYQLDIRSSINLTVCDNEFYDLTSGGGFCLGTTSARGRLSGNKFINVDPARMYQASGSEELGVDAPTWTGTTNDFVEKLDPQELGTAAAKYMLLGWKWDSVNAAWKQCRALTGN